MSPRKTLVVYCSNTGTTVKLAERIAENLPADKERITCTKNYHGFLGYLRAGYDSFRGNLPQIAAVHHQAVDYDLVIVGAPIWAGQAAPPIRTYLRDNRNQFNRIALFTTAGGSTPPRAFAEMARCAGQAPAAELAVSMQAVRDDGYAADLTHFIEQLSFKQAA